MNIIEIEFLSKILNRRKKMNIIMPEFYDIKKGETYPVIYCLHGLSGNCNDWLISGGAKDIFADKKIFAVFPSADNSFYCDMKYGANYYDYIAHEIQEYIENLFPINTSKRYIAGLSMGGYGALKIALQEPERYCAVAGFSGVLDIEDACSKLGNQDIVKELKNCFGEDLVVPKKDNLFYLAKQDVQIPIYISCGTEDFLYEQNKKFVESNSHLKINFTEEKGGHEWFLWHKNLKKFVEGIFNKSV